MKEKAVKTEVSRNEVRSKVQSFVCQQDFMVTWRVGYERGVAQTCEP